MTIRLCGTPAEVGLAIHRLRNAFSTVTVSELRPCSRNSARVRACVEVTF